MCPLRGNMTLICIFSWTQAAIMFWRFSNFLTNQIWGVTAIRRAGCNILPFGLTALKPCWRQRNTLKATASTWLGPTHHGIFKSIYFFDPNGHRLELCADIGTPTQLAELKDVAPDMLDEWAKTKKAPRHAAWLHEIKDKE